MHEIWFISYTLMNRKPLHGWLFLSGVGLSGCPSVQGGKALIPQPLSLSLSLSHSLNVECGVCVCLSCAAPSNHPSIHPIPVFQAALRWALRRRLDARWSDERGEGGAYLYHMMAAYEKKEREDSTEHCSQTPDFSSSSYLSPARHSIREISWSVTRAKTYFH